MDRRQFIQALGVVAVTPLLASYDLIRIDDSEWVYVEGPWDYLYMDGTNVFIDGADAPVGFTGVIVNEGETDITIQTSDKMTCFNGVGIDDPEDQFIFKGKGIVSMLHVNDSQWLVWGTGIS